MQENKGLRTGFTTGTAATAASLAALIALYEAETASFVLVSSPSGIIKVPVGSVFFSRDFAVASVTKDGGDDPDCTHGVEIVASVYKGGFNVDTSGFVELKISNSFRCYTGEGIGVVTTVGLPVRVGEPAVNPVPRKMLKENLENVVKKLGLKEAPVIVLTVPTGKEVAKHTLNERLGIKGGISILGTTGVVRPVSMEAYTATIDMLLERAKAKGLKEVVLCFGRTSEEAAMSLLNYPEEAYIVMGDFFGYALNKAKRMKFKVTVAGQPAKILKAAMDIDNTNVKYSVFAPEQLTDLLRRLSFDEGQINNISKAKTAKHIIEIVEQKRIKGLWERLVGYLAERHNIYVLLFSYEGELLARS